MTNGLERSNDPPTPLISYPRRALGDGVTRDFVRLSVLVERDRTEGLTPGDGEIRHVPLPLW